MDESLLQLVRISNTVGKDAALIQGGGGNTSVKTEDGEHMYIKASGTSLKDMSAQSGWRRLRLGAVVSIIKDESIAKLDTYAREAEVVNRLLGACDDAVGGDSRPSVEAHLHAFGGKCVLHLHPAAVLAYACARDGQRELEELFKDEEPAVLWVPYADPGFNLAKRVWKLLGEYQGRFGRKPAICFLEKHGLLISADSADGALELLGAVISRCSSKLKQLKAQEAKPVSRQAIEGAKACIRRGVLEGTGREVAISYFYSETIAGFWRQADASEMLGPAALTPDELLYANGPAMWVGRCDAKRIAGRLAGQLAQGRRASVAFLVKGVGLFVAAKPKIAVTVKEIVESSFFIRSNAFRMGGILSLNGQEQDFICNWEPDAFRKKLANGTDDFFR